MAYKNLIEVARYLEEYEKETLKANEGFSMGAFAFWLANKVAEKPREANFTKETDSINQQPIDVQISILIGRMAKFARNYSKKILSKTNLSGLDDYSFMATLMFYKSLTKSELTHHNLTESTSGADIIRRLEKHEYVEEFDDPNDKRSKRVKITEKGKKVMFMVFNEMEVASMIITGDLTDTEKLFLLKHLRKLDSFHHEIYQTDRKSELNFIREKYLMNG